MPTVNTQKNATDILTNVNVLLQAAVHTNMCGIGFSVNVLNVNITAVYLDTTFIMVSVDV